MVSSEEHMKTVAETIMGGGKNSEQLERACDMECVMRLQTGGSTRWVFRDGSQLVLSPDGIWWGYRKNGPLEFDDCSVISPEVRK